MAPIASQPEFAGDLQRYLVRADAVARDETLSAARGWIEVDVKWLVTRQTVGSEKTVLGRTVLKPGAKHDIHRHPNAEEWEFLVSGHAIKHIGDGFVEMEAGDVAFIPTNVYHGLENASSTEPCVSIWGYSGAASLEEAGYFLPSDDEQAPTDAR